MIRRAPLSALAVLAMALAASAQAQPSPPPSGPLYVGLGINGEIEVSPLPFHGARALAPHSPGWLDGAPAAPAPMPAAIAPATAKAARDPAINAAVLKAADRHGVDANLLHAVIKVESNYRRRAVSRVGAAGLMQLMPATAKRFGVSDRFNIEQNISGGAAYLKWLSKRFAGNLDLILAAYNAGEGAVQKHGNRIPPYKETRAYVSKVREHYVAFGP